MEGFKIVGMNMRDANTGSIVWESEEEWTTATLGREIEAHLPASILACSAVSREITFHAPELCKAMRLEQRVMLHGQCIEQWDFDFGFVIPGSTNSWQSVVDADAGNMLPAEILSGNLVIESSFLDEEAVVSKSTVRIFYDE